MKYFVGWMFLNSNGVLVHEEENTDEEYTLFMVYRTENAINDARDKMTFARAKHLKTVQVFVTDCQEKAK